MGRRSRSAEKESFWRMVLDEHGRSGLTVRAFCRREGLSEASFYSWRREIQRRDEDGSKVTVDAPSNGEELVPVRIVDESARRETSWRFEIATRSGLVLRFDHVSQDDLETVLTVLMRCEQGLASC